MTEDQILPEECPLCSGFTEYFRDEYICRDCGATIAFYKDGKWHVYDLEKPD